MKSGWCATLPLKLPSHSRAGACGQVAGDLGVTVHGCTTLRARARTHDRADVCTRACTKRILVHGVVSALVSSLSHWSVP
jgi:hypothetical protein